MTWRWLISSRFMDKLSFNSSKYLLGLLPIIWISSCTTSLINIWFIAEVTSTFKKCFWQVYLFLRRHPMFQNCYFETLKFLKILPMCSCTSLTFIKLNVVIFWIARSGKVFKLGQCYSFFLICLDLKKIIVKLSKTNIFIYSTYLINSNWKELVSIEGLK